MDLLAPSTGHEFKNLFLDGDADIEVMMLA
jgi:hypothetical protein